MISDTLSEAVSEIDRYLTEMPDVYQGDLRARIVKVRNDMEAIREELDAPPQPAATFEKEKKGWNTPRGNTGWIIP